jgi:hypothetical protein
MRWCDVLRRIKKLEMQREREMLKGEDGFFEALGADGEQFDYDAVAVLEQSAAEDWADYTV